MFESTIAPSENKQLKFTVSEWRGNSRFEENIMSRVKYLIDSRLRFWSKVGVNFLWNEDLG